MHAVDPADCPRKLRSGLFGAEVEPEGGLLPGFKGLEGLAVECGGGLVADCPSVGGDLQPRLLPVAVGSGRLRPDQRREAPVRHAAGRDPRKTVAGCRSLTRQQVDAASRQAPDAERRFAGVDVEPNAQAVQREPEGQRRAVAARREGRAGEEQIAPGRIFVGLLFGQRKLPGAGILRRIVQSGVVRREGQIARPEFAALQPREPLARGAGQFAVAYRLSVVDEQSDPVPLREAPGARIVHLGPGFDPGEVQADVSLLSVETLLCHPGPAGCRQQDGNAPTYGTQ